MTTEKAYNVKLTKELWAFVKSTSVDQDVSMNDIILKSLKQYKKKLEKKLTDKNI